MREIRMLSRFGHRASSLRLAVMFHDIGHALVLTSRHFAEHIENSLIGAVLLRTVEKIRLSRRETQTLEKPAEMRWYMPFAWHDYLHMVDPRFLTLAHAGASKCIACALYLATENGVCHART